MDDRGSAPKSGSSENRSTSNALSFAELLATANPGERDYSRLLLALCGSMLVVAISICGSVLLDRVRLPNMIAQSVQGYDSSSRDEAKTLQDVLEGQKQMASWDPVISKSQKRGSMNESAENLLVSVAPSPVKRGIRDSLAKSKEMISDDGFDPAYAALWGSGDRYAELGRRASSEAARATPLQDHTDEAQGMGIVLPARLLDQVAGSPTGAPAIAVLIRRQRLGTLVLPANTEIHGTVAGTGADDTRIFLDFEFLRLRDGRVVPIRGVARDPQGRHGIPAKRIFGHGAAGSIGLASASRAVRHVGRHVAGRIGDAVGAGLEGATDSATDKVQRADRDEHVLIAAAGVSLSIYIQSGS